MDTSGVCPESSPQTENLGCSKWTDPGSISNHLPKEAEGQSEDTEELVTPVETFTKLLLGGICLLLTFSPKLKHREMNCCRFLKSRSQACVEPRIWLQIFVQDERRSKTFLRKSSNGGDAAGRSPTVRAVCPE